MPFAYVPKSLANNVRSNSVIDIFLCAYEAGPVSAPQEPGFSVDTRKTNHWVMYLSESSTRSIRLDPSPTGPGNSLDLIITMDHSYTEHAVKIMHLTPAANLTVGHVLDCITNAKYDKYIFSPGGQGCRFWLYSVVALLHSAQCITDNSEVKASADALKLVWATSGDRAPADQQTDMIEGTFEGRY